MSDCVALSLVSDARIAAPRDDVRTGRTARGALLSLAAHAGVLGALSLALLAPLHERAAAPDAVALVFAAPAAPAAVPAPIARPAQPMVQQPLPAPVPQPVQLPAPRMPMAPPRIRSAAKPPRALARDAAAEAEALPAAASPRTPPQIASPAEPMHQAAEDVAGLKVLIQRAVQEAAIYPQRARLLHRQGRAQVRFDYAGGSVAGVALAQSSQSPMLDEAALDAVRRASYPKAAAQLRLALLVWVNFAVAAD